MKIEEIKRAILHTKNNILRTSDVQGILHRVENLNQNDYFRMCLKALESELERLENKPLTIEELILLLQENETYPVWIQRYKFSAYVDIIATIAVNCYDGKNVIYFLDDDCVVFNDNVKFYKHKPKED